MGLEIGIMCKNCNGTGQMTSAVPETPTVDCQFCGGDGITKLFMPNGYRYSVDILECINFSESEELSEEQSFSLNLILAPGVVDMATGSKARTKLAALFPSGNTNTSISALIEESL